MDKEQTQGNTLLMVCSTIYIILSMAFICFLLNKSEVADKVIDDCKTYIGEYNFNKHIAPNKNYIEYNKLRNYGY